MPEDELRPVTVLFADIVGSTALGERLAPDEVKALVGECVTMMSRAVEEYGGMVQAYAGDGICAYFGVPAAHQDDPERAARAGLRILEVVDEYAKDVEAAWGLANFSVRVGINSGHAAVGQVGAAEPGAVALGDTTNVAARLQSLAEPGTILVGEAAVRRLAHRFAFDPARRSRSRAARSRSGRRGSSARGHATRAKARRRWSAATRAGPADRDPRRPRRRPRPDRLRSPATRAWARRACSPSSARSRRTA